MSCYTCWCSSSPPSCALLVLVVITFLHFVNVHWAPFVMFYWCLLHPWGPFITLYYCSLALFIVFYWCLSWPPYVLCWCSFSSFCYTLLVFIDVPLQCFVGVRWHPLVALYWCSLVPTCCALLVLGISLTFLVHQNSFVMFCYCSSMPSYYVLLVLLFGIPCWYFLLTFCLQVCRFRNWSFFQNTFSNIHK